MADEVENKTETENSEPITPENPGFPVGYFTAVYEDIKTAGDWAIKQHELNVTRWTENAFYHGGRGITPRLDQIINEANPNTTGPHDLTDLGLARQLLNRANLNDRPFYNEFLHLMAGFLSVIPDPMRTLVNPDALIAKPGDIQNGGQ